MFKTSEKIEEIAGALAKAQAKFPDIPKDKEVTVKMKSGGTYSYKYAELSSIIKATRGPLSENGISFIQTIGKNGDQAVCVTRLQHSSGQWYETEYPVIYSEDDMQGVAGGFTFARRYGFTALIGAASEEDTDGNGANREKQKTQGGQKPHTAPPKDTRAHQMAKGSVITNPPPPGPPPNHAPVDWKPNPPIQLDAMGRMELSKWVIPDGVFKGRKLGEVDQQDIYEYRNKLVADFQRQRKQPPPVVVTIIESIDAYWSELF